MVQHCCVVSCGEEALRGSRISFFRFPKCEKMRRKWLAAVRRTQADLFKNKDLRVCSKHFGTSDYVFGGLKKKLKAAAVPNIPTEMEDKENMPSSSTTRPFTAASNVMQHLPLQESNGDERNDLAGENIILKATIKQQCEKLEVLQRELEYLRKENKKFREEQQQQNQCTFCLQRFMSNKKKILYYTGFESYTIMKTVYDMIMPHMRDNTFEMYSLSLENQFFLTMMWLRRGLHYETLGDMFGVSKATAGKCCLRWINEMFLRLGSLNIWPHRNILIENAPIDFKEKYKNVIGSIDCTELYIERPSSLVKQSECFSHYKGATTLKSLIMTDPNGSIIYLSPLYTGSISDRGIIAQSGFLEILKRKVNCNELYPGDIILADKGFNVTSLFEEAQLTINIPTFRISGVQFTEKEVEWIRKVARERIHIERAIGRLKQYRILTKKIPVSLLGTIEQIYTVCCILTNFRSSLRK